MDSLELLYETDSGISCFKLNTLHTVWILEEPPSLILGTNVAGNAEGLAEAMYKGIWLNERELVDLRNHIEMGEIRKAQGNAVMTGRYQTLSLWDGRDTTEMTIMSSFHHGLRIRLRKADRLATLTHRIFYSLCEKLDDLLFTKLI
jgi:hypothetical protein